VLLVGCVGSGAGDTALPIGFGVDPAGADTQLVTQVAAHVLDRAGLGPIVVVSVQIVRIHIVRVLSR